MKQRLAGLGFLVVLVGLVGLCVASYAKVFTPGFGVMVNAESAGLQMSKGADVKMNGVLVGEVRSIESSGHGAQLELSLDPVAKPKIPGDVVARLLPKTLFGEKYVQLVPQESESSGSISENAVIEVDKSHDAVELEDVLDGALPLLRAVPPEKLAVTLSSISTALEGRGEQLGDTIVKLGDVVRELNDEMPTITHDIEQLATVLDTYEGAADDLLQILENLTVTNKTVTDQSDNLKALWIAGQDFGYDTRVFLDRYQGRLIQFGEVTQPVLEVLATYSPEYPCIFQGLTALEPRIEDSFSNGRLHITLEIVENNGKYEKGRDEPEWLQSYGPDCRGLPNPDVPGPERQYGNGYDYDASRSNLPIEIPGLTDFDTGSDDPSAEGSTDDEDADEDPTLPFDPRMGYSGTDEETDVINPVVAASTGKEVDDVPDWAPLMWGPILRGNEISLR
ncbi:MAG TPA: MCE family protein [Candidatus Stackebrandtia faecavium]|nr:MCE family protein [Candidatus Stackebrandtia faecavium]